MSESIIVKENHFSGGNLNSLADIIRGLAIDNARQLADRYPITVIDETEGRASAYLHKASLPSGQHIVGGTPASAASVTLVTEEANAVLAVLYNSVDGFLARLGLSDTLYVPPGNENCTVPSIPNYVECDNDDPALLDHAVMALSSLRNNLSVIIYDVNQIAAALGYPMLLDETGGTPRAKMLMQNVEVSVAGHGDPCMQLNDVQSFMNVMIDNIATVCSFLNRLFIGMSKYVDLGTIGGADTGAYLSIIPELSGSKSTHDGQDVSDAVSVLSVLNLWIEAISSRIATQQIEHGMLPFMTPKTTNPVQFGVNLELVRRGNPVSSVSMLKVTKAQTARLMAASYSLNSLLMFNGYESMTMHVQQSDDTEMPDELPEVKLKDTTKGATILVSDFKMYVRMSMSVIETLISRSRELEGRETVSLNVVAG